jgi:hypothetical protein
VHGFPSCPSVLSGLELKAISPGLIPERTTGLFYIKLHSPVTGYTNIFEISRPCHPEFISGSHQIGPKGEMLHLLRHDSLLGSSESVKDTFSDFSAKNLSKIRSEVDTTEMVFFAGTSAILMARLEQCHWAADWHRIS